MYLEEMKDLKMRGVNFMREGYRFFKFYDMVLVQLQPATFKLLQGDTSKGFKCKGQTSSLVKQPI